MIARLARDVLDSRTYGRIGYLLLALPLGVIEFSFLVTAISFGVGTAVTLIGIPVLIFTIYAAREREVLLDADALKEAFETVKEWRAASVLPLRAVRRRLSSWTAHAAVRPDDRPTFRTTDAPGPRARFHGGSRC